MKIIVDNQKFIIGLNELYREAMKVYEVETLLPLAKVICHELSIEPLQNIPIEGYYYESEELTLYFRLIRTLQKEERRAEYSELVARSLTKLCSVLGSPALGRIERNETSLLPMSSSPLGEALRSSLNWSIAGLCQAAQQNVMPDDANLVAVGAVSGDAVALCACRESMALYHMVEMACASEPEPVEYIWQVSDDVLAVANRFVSALHESTGIALPPVIEKNAKNYAEAAEGARLYGRCIAIGTLPTKRPPYYHWYVTQVGGQYVVKDFWASEIWTTEHLINLPSQDWPDSGSHMMGQAPKAVIYEDAENSNASWVTRWMRKLFGNR